MERQKYIIDNQSKTSRIKRSVNVLVWIGLLDSEERTGRQDAISRNELAQMNCRDK